MVWIKNGAFYFVRLNGGIIPMTIANFRNFLAATAIASSAAMTAEAATYPTFVLDTGASSIDVTQGSGCQLFSCATLIGSFGSGATGFNWTPTSAYESVHVDNFFDWVVSGAGLESFTVAVTLVFSQPDATFSNGSGSGLFATFYGIVSAGFLQWSSIDSVTFAQGSTLDIGFDDVYAYGFGNSVSSGATFTGNPVVEVSPVPLPASVPLLGAGLLALGLIGRRRKAA